MESTKGQEADAISEWITYLSIFVEKYEHSGVVV